jgi:tRNA (cmo5U34)-methyltransferase
MSESKDNIFDEPYSQIRAFAFDEKVVSVFPDMIKRSVPGYDTILKGIAMLAMKYIRPKTHVYDLGASLGAVSLTIDQAVGDQQLRIHAVDNSQPMIEGLKRQLSSVALNNQIKPVMTDIADLQFMPSSFVVSNFTLQFMPKETRKHTCELIHQSLQPGGVFVLSEKVTSSDLLIDYYHGYKKINGYSDREVAQKRQALEDALRPDSVEHWQARLRAVGFQTVEVWFRAFNFVSLVAIK